MLGMLCVWIYNNACKWEALASQQPPVACIEFDEHGVTLPYEAKTVAWETIRQIQYIKPIRRAAYISLSFHDKKSMFTTFTVLDQLSEIKIDYYPTESLKEIAFMMQEHLYDAQRKTLIK